MMLLPKNTPRRAPRGLHYPGSSRKPIAHGTIGGYRAHYRHGEPMCEPCREANRQYHGQQPKTSARCGTRSGYNRHIKAGEPTCAACRDAHALAMRERGGYANWPYEQLVPAVTEGHRAGLSPAEIADQLGVSRLRVGRALARARRDGALAA